MRSRFLGLALLIGVAPAVEAKLEAQTPTKAPAPSPAADEVVLPALPAVPVSSDIGKLYEPRLPPPPPAAPVGPVRQWLRSKGYCCWSTHNCVGCGSFKADAVFMLGSCRAFFDEPCLPQPARQDPTLPGDTAPRRCCR